MAAEANVQPSAYPRRSFLYRKLAAAGANFGEVYGAAVAMDFGDPEGEAAGEAAVARRLGLADISPLPHTGFKGAGVVDWLRRQGVEVSEEPNWAPRQAGGGLALRQAQAELRTVAVDLAIHAASKLLDKNLDDAAQRQLVERHLADLERSGGSSTAPS